LASRSRTKVKDNDKHYCRNKLRAPSANLFKVERYGDPVELSSVGDGRALPPAIAAVDGEVDWMTFSGAGAVTDSALDAVSRTTLHVLYQLTERLGALFAARSVRCDVGVGRQVKHVRKPTFQHTHVQHVYTRQCKDKVLPTTLPEQLVQPVNTSQPHTYAHARSDAARK